MAWHQLDVKAQSAEAGVFISREICNHTFLYFYDDERCKMNFPVRDNKVLLYCIVLYCIVERVDFCTL